MRSLRTSFLLAPALALTLLAACSDDDDGLDEAASDVSEAVDSGTDDAVEVAARNIASAQGEDEFAAAGVDVEGDLSCEATVADEADAVEISCTGTGTDGEALKLAGTTDEVPGASVTELEGTFVGTADDEEVFTVDTLGG